ncbi:MAG: thioether cross-link-forming SCIFF peptide maturase [Clostridiales bacterium]|nr:thioether cross-link-forming SCIFF peptide maturase [Clostridiales bacterium]
MVEVFSSSVSGEKRYFVYDVESGSLMNVDAAAFLIAKSRYSSLSSDESLLYSSIDENLKKEIEGELLTLEKEGVLNSKPADTEIKFCGDIKAMCLHICHDCNLRCPYCFAKDGTYNTPKDYMSFEVGKAAIDFLIERSGVRKNLEVDFFGGEPLMNIEVVKRIVNYAKSECEKRGKNISFTLTTNAVLLNEDNRKFLNEEMENVVISIDGRQETHDALRKTPNGSGSHAIALKNAKEFRKIRGDKKYYIRGTFTKKNLDFTSDAVYLAENGFDQISLEPVVLDESDELAIKMADIDRVNEEYEKLAKTYIKMRKEGKWFNFFHFMIDLKHGPCVHKRLRGCGAGSEYVAVTPSGDIYPCHQFVTHPEYKMGNVLDGDFNESIQKTFFENTVVKKDECLSCAAKYHCSGGCAANALNFSGSINGVHEVGCALMKKRFLLSLAIYDAEA